MKADMHVHSKHSRRPSEWILQKLGCPESFTEPADVYRISRDRGMSLVTITDHNTIEGCAEIAHLPGVFMSEEITTYFPEDAAKIHVLAYNITPVHHAEIQYVRENVYDLVDYLNRHAILHAVAHPLFSVREQISVSHFEKMLLLFRNFELNGARDAHQNDALRAILTSLAASDVDSLANKHNLAPAMPEPWRKNLVSGSDDHSSLTIAHSFTEVAGASGHEDFLAGIAGGCSVVSVRNATPHTLARNIYAIAYQFYRDRLSLGRYSQRDPILSFLDRNLRNAPSADPTLFDKIALLWNTRRPRRSGREGETRLMDSLKNRARDLIMSDPEILARLASTDPAELDALWFRFVSRVSHKVLAEFSSRLGANLFSADLFDIFQSVGSAGALYMLLAPYFLSFSVFVRDRAVTGEVISRFGRGRGLRVEDSPRIAHFTDTFNEVNGVARTLSQQVAACERMGYYYRVVTCNHDPAPQNTSVINFLPVGTYSLPEYPEMNLQLPPFLEMLDYVHSSGFTRIHAATPGPLGLAALGIARILGLPIDATYHTALPQYGRHLTGDQSVEDLMWKLVVWYYSQVDTVYVPSQATAHELAARGIDSSRIRIFPRGVDIDRFNPARKGAILKDKFHLGSGVRLLYVGRVSREKNLELLVDAFKSLTRSMSNVHLVVAGDGPYLADMKNALKDTPALFTGYLQGDELSQLYASCDLFVFPSATDTFGNVVLEAQASGLPVIVTDNGGPQENVVDGKTGLVVPAGSAESLLDAMRDLLSQPARRRAMGRAARQLMESRSFDVAFSQTWEMYRTAGQPTPLPDPATPPCRQRPGDAAGAAIVART